MPDDPATPPAPDPVERRELGQALEAALAQLRPDQRAAVILRYESGLSFDEIGDGPRRSGGHSQIACPPRPQGAGAAADRVGMGPAAVSATETVTTP